FDKEKEQRRLQTVGLISDIGSQVADIARTQGELNALKAAQDKYGPVPADATEEQRQAYLAKLRDTPEYKKEQEKYGTGSDMQRGIQAATAALQGLAGGNMAGALAGASAPELANIIGHHAGIDDNTAAKAIAHAILGGVTAALQGNSAAAGAIGAGTGEVIASAIAKSLYPDVDPSKLTEEQKQTVGTLATLSAGMAGGIASGDVAGAAAGAGAGKNVVENNLLGGSEDAQAAWIRQHGIDMATCAENPSGAACQKAMNERDAVGLALATGTVALLPGSAQAMWGLGASANAGISYLADGTVDPANAAIAGWVNVFSMGNGLAGTVGWNAAGGALGNWIDNKDPLSGAISNGIGSAAGYGIGKGVTWGTDKITNAVGKWVTNGWDPKYDPTWIKYAEVNRNDIIREGMKPSNVPGTAGDIGGSIGSELGGKVTDKVSEELKK
ncbi:VENN motif pre-toxin domain-containing protein, partial [Escherichia coli]|uniref:VENN motif pre-toxin domain-containing protein n=1 Tax=Escherichia coli TaxID=562 RepID=UPI00207BEE97